MIELRADGYKQMGMWYEFVVLVVGDPNVELAIARIPRDIVESIEGGP